MSICLIVPQLLNDLITTALGKSATDTDGEQAEITNWGIMAAVAEIKVADSSAGAVVK